MIHPWVAFSKLLCYYYYLVALDIQPLVRVIGLILQKLSINCQGKSKSARSKRPSSLAV